MTSCRCVRLRVDGGTSATVRVNDPPAVTFGADEYAPYVPIMDEYQGPYEVTPTQTAQVLPTEGLLAVADIVVNPIPPEVDGDDLAYGGAFVGTALVGSATAM